MSLRVYEAIRGHKIRRANFQKKFVVVLYVYPAALLGHIGILFFGNSYMLKNRLLRSSQGQLMKKYFYKTILQHNEHEIPKIKGSKFIGNIFHIKDKKQAEVYIKQIQKKYHDATHNCYAYTYGTNINFDLFGKLEITPKYQKQNDDGEPKNSAGKPILAQIQGQNLHNVLIIVTRYFGGTLLGVGGLIQAYGECAKQIILNSNLPAGRQGIKKIEITETIKISFDYNILSNIMNLINKYEAKINQENHGEKAEITLQINKGYLEEFKKEIFNQSKGKIIL